MKPDGGFGLRYWRAGTVADPDAVAPLAYADGPYSAQMRADTEIVRPAVPFGRATVKLHDWSALVPHVPKLALVTSEDCWPSQ